MYQQDRGLYRKNESLFSEFSHSCLGRLIFLIAILIVLAILAFFTNPSEQTMRQETVDNIRQCIETNDSINTDWIDDAINNVGYIFTDADSTVHNEMMDLFNEHNRLEFYDHSLYSTVRLYNNFNVEGTLCGLGIFGIVIPTLNFNEFLLRTAPMRKDYNQPAVRNPYGEDTYMGESPDLSDEDGVFEFIGEDEWNKDSIQ